MKVVILAGGFGTRLSEYTKTLPKPMVKVNGKPLLTRIMEHYFKYGFNNFYIALGYKGYEIKKYLNKNKKKFKNFNINLIETGLKTMTGGRLKRLEKYLKKETFCLTYGDGLSNINIKKLLGFHKYHCYSSFEIKYYHTIFSLDHSIGASNAAILYGTPSWAIHPKCTGFKFGPDMLKSGCLPRPDMLDDYEDYVNLLVYKFSTPKASTSSMYH